MTNGPYLAKPSAVREILSEYGLHTKKKYGQNFLIDAHVPEKILQTAAVTKEDNCLEIGPGIGTLTQYLAENAGRVVAVEIDASLLPVLSETLSAWDNVSIVHADILKTDVPALLREQGIEKNLKILANLPYYITTPILMMLLEAKLPAVSCTFMVQKEVADRMQAQPGTKEYGALSLAVQYYADASVAAVVPPGCFYPAPGVDSAVVHLRMKESLPLDEERERRFFGIIRAAFLQRRKTLQNALANHSPYGKETVRAAIAACGFREDVRGEALGAEDFMALEKELHNKKEPLFLQEPLS